MVSTAAIECGETPMRLPNSFNVALNVQVGMMATLGAPLLPLLLLQHPQVVVSPCNLPPGVQ